MSDLDPLGTPDADPFSELWESLRKSTERFGLYARDFAIGSPSHGAPEPDMTGDKMIQAIKDGEQYIVMASFVVGDLAWDEKVQDPAAFEEKQEFRKIVPDVAADIKAQLEEKLRNGEDPF